VASPAEHSAGFGPPALG